MIVCHCRAVSDRAITAQVLAGADSVDQLAKSCGAGDDCGGCHRRLERLLAEAERLSVSAA
jgi:bacterioferritin-associated ferredoxin